MAIVKGESWPLQWTLSGAAVGARGLQLLHSRVSPQEEPLNIIIDGCKSGSAAGVDLSRIQSFREVFIEYPRAQHFSVDSTVVNVRFRHDVEVDDVFAAVENAHFDLFVMSSPFARCWRKTYGYRSPGFADNHISHGWACAFRGVGHDRLVSRRWLEYGPWRLIRDETHDISFVQFHDLEADAETALEQARPGHQRMGISATGGFLQTNFAYKTDLHGFYLDDELVLEIVVAGREVEQREMLDACAARHYQIFGPDQPLRNVRFVFIEGEAAARAHLHELWLRELECWAIIDGDKVRLDETYEPPPPVKPDWVRQVEAREATA